VTIHPLQHERRRERERKKERNIQQQLTDVPQTRVQQANSYIEGLEPIPFHEVEDHPWMVELEKHAETIRKEFILSQARDLSRGNRIWEMALTKDALAYGPDWRTLVLQDRGRWEPTNTQFFPNTTKIIKSLNAPT